MASMLDGPFLVNTSRSIMLEAQIKTARLRPTLPRLLVLDAIIAAGEGGLTLKDMLDNFALSSASPSTSSIVNSCRELAQRNLITRAPGQELKPRSPDVRWVHAGDGRSTYGIAAHRRRSIALDSPV